MARPHRRSWAEPKRPLRLVEQTVAQDDPDPKALPCYGLLLAQTNRVWLRFVDGRPKSGVTTHFLAWCAERLWAEGKTALLMVWDNAGWHVSHEVQDWLRDHNRQVKRSGVGARIIACPLPSKSPWLNPIEPHWVHGKRRVMEPDRLLSAQELEARVCAAFVVPSEDHLAVPKEVAC